MAQRFQSALSRRDRIWPTALFSGALHAALVAFAILRGSGPDIDLEQKPIVAKLVRLGEERPKQLLPRKEQPPPPPAAAEPAPVPVPTAPAPVAPAPAVATAKPTAPKTAPPKQVAPTKQPQPPASSRRTLSNVLDRVRSETAEEQYGSPDGDPMGDSSDGEEGDRYLALVKRALDDNFTAPAVISERERLHLQADVILYIEPDGRIDRFTFERRSGNGAFDAALERTVRTTRVPPPPPEKREAYRRGGIRLTYRPS
jgi:colicin import membrane protein